MATSWRDPRPAGHDELVAICLKNVDEVVRQCGGAPRGNVGPLRPILEHPCGGGFIDLLLVWTDNPKDALFYSPKIIVEVKSEREAWNAGDVLRQLKRYQRDMVAQSGAEPGRLALLAGRTTTDVERRLLEHEGVTILDL